MISDRRTGSLLATLLSIPPILLVAALVNKLMPPPPPVPSIVAANDRQVDAVAARPKAPHRDRWSGDARPLAYNHESTR